MAHYEDIPIDQGADVAIEIHLRNRDGSKKDLTDHFVQSRYATSYHADSDDRFYFISMIPEPPTDGLVYLQLSNTQTSSMNYKKKYVYDVEIYFNDSASNTIIERVLEGQLLVSPSVT
jgi:hypothetical protein